MPPTIDQLYHIEGNGKKVEVIGCVASKWERLAASLRFNPFDIQRIERDHRYSCTTACQTVFIEWLSGRDGTRRPISWATIKEVLDEIHLSEISSDLQTILSS